MLNKYVEQKQKKGLVNFKKFIFFEEQDIPKKQQHFFVIFPYLLDRGNQQDLFGLECDRKKGEVYFYTYKDYVMSDKMRGYIIKLLKNKCHLKVTNEENVQNKSRITKMYSNKLQIPLLIFATQIRKLVFSDSSLPHMTQAHVSKELKEKKLSILESLRNTANGKKL